MLRLSRGRTLVHGPQPTGRGWGLLVAGMAILTAAALWERQDLLLLGLALVMLPLASMIVVALSRPRLGVHRVLAPDVIAVGDDSVVSLTLTNPQGHSGMATAWRDLVPNGIRPQHAKPLPLEGAAGTRFLNGTGALVVRHRVRADARGIFDIGPLVVLRRDPFGLARCEYSLGPAGRLVVTPRVDPLSEDELETFGGDGSELQVLRRTSPEADELIAREYRAGDPMRRVHWRATARFGELMVRQEEQRSNPEAWIVFDTRRRAQAEARHPSAREAADAEFERAVGLIAALGARLIDLGYRVSVLETGTAQLVHSRGAVRSGLRGSAAPAYEEPGGERALLVGLAGVHPRDGENAGYSAELTGALHREGGTAPVFAVLLGATEELNIALSAVPTLSHSATAFLVGDGAAPLEHALTAAGWRCAAYVEGTRPHIAWLAARSAVGPDARAPGGPGAAFGDQHGRRAPGHG